MAYDPLAPYLPTGSVLTQDHIAHLDAGIMDALAAAGDLEGPLPQWVSARDFGAKGDGTTDDTTSLQAWLDYANAQKFLPAGTYRITATLTSGVAGATITGPGTILAGIAEIDMLRVTGAGTTVQGLQFDGASAASIGISVQAPGAVLDGLTIENLSSTSGTARGVDSNTSGGFTVRDSAIRNITATGDATLGNGAGMARGIVVYAPNAATGDTLIESNTIDTITGEEGDGVAVLFGGTGVDPFHEARTTIRGNSIRDCSRRFLKVQGSGVTVDSNRCVTSTGFTAANPSSGIGVIQSDRVTITSNEVRSTALGPAVHITGSAAYKPVGIRVAGNEVAPSATQPGVYAKWVASSTFTGTRSTGGTNTVLLGEVDDVVVTGSVGDNPDTTVPVVSINSASNRVTVTGTAHVTAGRGNLVANASVGGFSDAGLLVDTGWRNISSLVPGYISGALVIRRVGPLVELRATSLVFAGTTLVTIPSGFRSGAWIQFHTAPYWSSEVLEKFRVKNEGPVEFAAHGDTNVVAFNVQWFTTNPAPTTYPGVAA